MSRSKVPARAILIASLFSYVALAASVLSPDRVFNFLVSSSGAIMLFIYMLIAWAQLRLRAQIEAEDPSRLQVKMWLFPYATWATIAGMAAILVLMGLAERTALELGASVLVTLAFLIGYWAKTRLQAKAQTA